MRQRPLPAAPASRSSGVEGLDRAVEDSEFTDSSPWTPATSIAGDHGSFHNNLNRPALKHVKHDSFMSSSMDASYSTSTAWRGQSFAKEQASTPRTAAMPENFTHTPVGFEEVERDQRNLKKSVNTQADATVREARRKRWLELLRSFSPMFACIAIALIGWWMVRQPGKLPIPDPIDDFVKSQDEWVGVADLVTQYDNIPIRIKAGETAMTDLMIAVKYSGMPGRHRFVNEMQQFTNVAERSVETLLDWNSLIGDTVDKVQNTNYHALTAYQNLQSMSSWIVIPAPSADSSGLMFMVQQVGHQLSTTLVGNREAKAKQLQELFILEVNKAGEQLHALKVGGTALASDFRNMGYHLKNIAEIARSEEAQLKAEIRDLLSGIWGVLGFNDYAARDLSSQAQLLSVMADAMMEGHGYINEMMLKIRSLDKDFGRLYKALSESKWEQAGAMPLRLDNIQAAIDKLDGARRSSKSRLQSGQYYAARNKMIGGR